MSKAFMAVGIILIGLITYGMVNVIQSYSTGNEMDYYVLKETTKGAMEDSIDYSFYRIHGVMRMDKEKFMENFTRRFANNVSRTKNYKIKFYDINETPPKVSVKVENYSADSYANSKPIIENRLDAIIESLYYDNMIIDTICSEKNTGSNNGEFNICNYNSTVGEDYKFIIN